METDRSADRHRRGRPWDDPLVPGALGLALGILLVDSLPSDQPPLILLVSICALCLVGAARLRGRRPWLVRPTMLRMIPLLGMLALGAARGRPPVDLLPVPQEVGAPAPLASVEGTVQQALMPSSVALAGPEIGRDTWSALLLGDVRLECGGPILYPRGRVRVVMPPSTRLIERGTRIHVTGSIIAPRRPRNPGEADGLIRRRRQAEAAVLRVPAASAIQILAGPPRLSPLAAIDRTRAAILRHLTADLSSRSAALSAALLLGLRDGLDPEFRDSVAATGVIHLLAISGLHIVLIVGSLRALLGLLVRPLLGDLLAILGALLYAALAGAGSPVLRASVGCAVVLVGRCVGRRPRTYSALALAFTVLLLIDPAELFRAGFQLSFVAVAALTMPGRRAPTHQRRSLKTWLLSGLAVSVRASLVTAPIILFHFGRIAPLGPLFTVLATPLFLATFGACVLHGLVGFFLGWIARIASMPTDLLCWSLAQAFLLAGAVPGATIYPPRTGLIATLLLLAAAFVLLSRRTVPAAFLVVVAMCIGQVTRGPPAEPHMWVFDVGHGQAVLLRSTTGVNVLVDCGSRGYRDVGRRTILPALDELGAGHIDLLVLSHFDADHINGVIDLVRAGRVAEIAYGDGPLNNATVRQLWTLARRHGVPRTVVVRGDVLLDEGQNGLHVEVLAPHEADRLQSDNDRSIVIRARLPEGSVLIPGDIESAGIRALLRAPQKCRADVLLLPHHGNPEPWLGPLIHFVRPKLVIASRHGRFHDATIPLLVRRAGGWLHSTGMHGAICVRFRTGSTLRAQHFLETTDKSEVTDSAMTR